jgi:hypothetical protein
MRRRRPEQTIQVCVIQHLRWRGVPGALYWHTPNGGWRSKAEAGAFKAMGTLSGVSDICILHDGRFHALELKAPGGRSSVAQLAFRDAVNAAGGFASEAVGIDAALACLQMWGLLR